MPRSDIYFGEIYLAFLMQKIRYSPLEIRVFRRSVGGEADHFLKMGMRVKESSSFRKSVWVIQNEIILEVCKNVRRNYQTFVRGECGEKMNVILTDGNTGSVCCGMQEE